MATTRTQRREQRRQRREEARRERRERRGLPRRVETPHLSLVRAPTIPRTDAGIGREIVVATYNVHRWTGLNGRSRPDPARAGFVISELEADVIALQEVLRPFDYEDPVAALAETLGLHVSFAVTRVHKRGQLGNAILSRWPMSSVSILDLTLSRLERRSAVAARFDGAGGRREGSGLAVVATHLSLVDRTRRRQVQMLLSHPQLQTGAAVLLGDMNAWRRCEATRTLERELAAHHNRDWPPSFPAARPVLALDRIYARGAEVVEVSSHDSQAARRASDHLPVLARIRLPSAV